MRPLLVIALAAAFGVSCSPTTPADPNAWTRVVGRVDAAVSSVPAIMFAPQPVRAGTLVVVTVSTYGPAGCIRPGETQLGVEGRIITITPYDSVAPVSVPCAQGIVRLPHEARLLFPQVGPVSVRVRGRDHRGLPRIIESTVDVLP